MVDQSSNRRNRSLGRSTPMLTSAGSRRRADQSIDHCSDPTDCVGSIDRTLGRRRCRRPRWPRQRSIGRSDDRRSAPAATRGPQRARSCARTLASGPTTPASGPPERSVNRSDDRLIDRCGEPGAARGRRHRRRPSDRCARGHALTIDRSILRSTQRARGNARTAARPKPRARSTRPRSLPMPTSAHVRGRSRSVDRSIAPSAGIGRSIDRPSDRRARGHALIDVARTRLRTDVGIGVDRLIDQSI